jgi:hypothetical protein
MSSYEYIEVSGTIVPDTAEIQAEVIAEYKSVFGQDLIVTANTPQGILITAETLSREGIARNNAALANQINPNIAGGIYLDGVLALTGAQRVSDTFSYTLCDLAGIAFTVIPAGVTAKNTNGFIFESETILTLDSTGKGQVTFRSIIPGGITCPIGTLTIIDNGVLGWETITNIDNAVLGSATQSDGETRTYRKNTLAGQGTSLPLAITSALYAVPGVRSLKFLENITNENIIKETIPLVPHSIWVCVDGGSDDDVAYQLFAKKSGGGNYNGAVNVIVIDPTSGMDYPVKFDRPDEINVLVRATIKADSTVNNPEESVIFAIISYANGLVNSEEGLVVGADVSPFELAGAITTLFPGIYVKKLEVSYASPVNYVVSELPIEINQKALIFDSSIQVIIV